MADLKDLTRLKMELFETDCPFFSEEGIRTLLSSAKTYEHALYYGYLAKAESGNFEIQGLSIDETRNMFLRLANEHRPSNSRLLT